MLVAKDVELMVFTDLPNRDMYTKEELAGIEYRLAKVWANYQFLICCGSGKAAFISGIEDVSKECFMSKGLQLEPYESSGLCGCGCQKSMQWRILIKPIALNQPDQLVIGGS